MPLLVPFLYIYHSGPGQNMQLLDRHRHQGKSNSTYEEVSSLEDTLPKLDVLYMTRVQKERFFNEEEYLRLKDVFILNEEKLKLADKDMPVLHPLPRVVENGRYGRVIYALITNMEAVRENYGNSECNN